MVKIDFGDFFFFADSEVNSQKYILRFFFEPFLAFLEAFGAIQMVLEISTPHQYESESKKCQAEHETSGAVVRALKRLVRL